jgi:1-pyrroline-5-carboxylate dehydrogenase
MFLQELKSIKVGQSDDPTSFLSAVIDENAFKDITGFIDRAKNNKTNNFISGGNYDQSKGYFIEPTIIECKDPHSETMEKGKFNFFKLRLTFV